MSTHPVKRISESLKPKGILYTFACGHTHLMSQEAVHEFVYHDGPNAPTHCPACESEEA